MSNVMSGVERSHRGEPSYRAHSTVRNESYLNNPTLGTSGPFKSKTLTAAPGKTSLQKTKNVPRTYASKSMPKSIFSIFARGPIKKPVVAAKPVAKKPVAKPAVQVVSNVTNAKMSPVKNSSVSKKPPATRFGTVTGKTTGTRVSGGGGYGGGGTRGGGSLSGGGSGTRSAGTSRTGGTRSNDPVRG
jgi:uncharacterized membrane protein YgcG